MKTARAPSRFPSSGRSFGFCAPLLVLSLLWVSGCGDLDTGPSVELLDDDPMVSLHFSDRLPTLPALIERWAPGRGLAPFVDAWQGSWELPAARGEPARRDAVEGALPLMMDVVPRTALDEAFRQVDNAIRGAEEALGASLSSRTGSLELTSSLGLAARHRDAARSARESGNDLTQLRHLLLASDALRSTTAGPLAVAFVEQAEVELRRIQGSETYPPVTRQRAERLLEGAREALDVGQPALALQRAWYALGLLRAGESMDTRTPDRDDDTDLP
ncbi:MAG: hypothetical protein EA350_17465 [Gemmatimonadales bacterium]|nr:MAG: hypothetical protein EA350_17465 [Gemmatimonadales bacterium]